MPSYTHWGNEDRCREYTHWGNGDRCRQYTHWGNEDRWREYRLWVSSPGDNKSITKKTTFWLNYEHISALKSKSILKRMHFME